MKKTLLLWVLGAIALTTGLSACGYRGDLYMPTPTQHSKA